MKTIVLKKWGLVLSACLLWAAPAAAVGNYTTIFSESFDDSPFVDRGWTTQDLQGSGMTWSWYSSVSTFRLSSDISSGGVVGADSDVHYGYYWDAALVSPAIDLGAAREVILRFAGNFQTFALSDRAFLDISTDSGATWTNLATKNSDDPAGGLLQEFFLNDYLGQTVQLRWRYVTGGTWEWFWYLDNILVYAMLGVEFPFAPATANQAAILASLTGLTEGAEGQTLDDLQALADLGDGAFQRGLDALSPEPYAALRDVSLQLTRRFAGIARSRTERLGDSARTLAGMPHHYAAANSVMSDVDYIAGEDSNGLWAQPFLLRADQDGSGGRFGYRHNAYGFVLGFDRRIGSNGLAGAFFGYGNGDVRYDTVNADTDLDSYCGGLYSGWKLGRFDVDGGASWTRNRYGTERAIQLADGTRKATSSHDGDEISAWLGGAYHWLRLGAFELQPMASLQYAYYDGESFDEKGADTFNLHVRGTDAHSIASRLGLRLSSAFSYEKQYITTEVRVEWAHEFGEINRQISANFAGVDTFTVDGIEPERDAAIIGLGVANNFTDHLSMFINGDVELRDDFSGWQIAAGMQGSF